MEIELSREHFENLLKLAHLGQWMANGVRAEEDAIKKLHDAGQVLLAHALREELHSFVALDELQKKLIAGPALEEDEELNELKEYYNEELFWTELTERLAARDFLETYGEVFATMSEAEKIQKKSEFLQKYAREFEKSGIDHLILAV